MSAVCDDCRHGAHVNCPEAAWDHDRDLLVPCHCPDPEHDR